MTWLIVIGVIIVLLLLHIAMILSGRKDGLVNIIGVLFVVVTIIAAIGLVIAGGYWLFTEADPIDAGSILLLELAGIGVLGLLLFVKDAVGWFKERRNLVRKLSTHQIRK
jgi:hypothetical protein